MKDLTPVVVVKDAPVVVETTVVKTKKAAPVSKKRHAPSIADRGIEAFISTLDTEKALKGVNIKDLAPLKKLMTVKPVDCTWFGRMGEPTPIIGQPVSGIVDGWIYKTCTAKRLHIGLVKTLTKACFTSINNTAKCGHLMPVEQIDATFTQIIQSLMAHRPESKTNSVKKLVAMGYTAYEAGKVLEITTKLAHGIRPVYMEARKLFRTAAKKELAAAKAKKAAAKK